VTQDFRSSHERNKNAYKILERQPQKPLICN